MQDSEKAQKKKTRNGRKGKGKIADIHPASDKKSESGEDTVTRLGFQRKVRREGVINEVRKWKGGGRGKKKREREVGNLFWEGTCLTKKMKR